VTDPINLAGEGIDREFVAESAATRRRFVQGAAATLGSMGLLGLVTSESLAAGESENPNNSPQNILNVATTAEVLATIVNTVGAERLGSNGRGSDDRFDGLLGGLGPFLGGFADDARGRRSRLDGVTTRNIRAAARHELIHYEVLTSLGGQSLATMIWVPDAVFATPRGLLETLEVGDQIFINAYMIATTVFGNAGDGLKARYTGEFMGVEAVHRALARQSLGKLGNDHTFMVYSFDDINVAVAQLQAAGFGFGVPGSKPGRFYDFAKVSQRTPDPAAVDARTVS